MEGARGLAATHTITTTQTSTRAVPTTCASARLVIGTATQRRAIRAMAWRSVGGGWWPVGGRLLGWALAWRAWTRVIFDILI